MKYELQITVDFSYGGDYEHHIHDVKEENVEDELQRVRDTAAEICDVGETYELNYNLIPLG